jgi:hypothetical protein
MHISIDKNDPCLSTLRDVEADVSGDIVGGGGGHEGVFRLRGPQLLWGEGESKPVVHGSHG